MDHFTVAFQFFSYMQMILEIDTRLQRILLMTECIAVAFAVIFYNLSSAFYVRDVVLGTCIRTRVVLEYKSRVLVLVLATLSSKY